MKNILTNAELFEYCLKNPEPLIDDSYTKSSGLIISADAHKTNNLTAAHTNLIRKIEDFKITKESHDTLAVKQIPLDIQIILKNKGMNYSEFVSFWSVLDVSYSVYVSLSETDQIQFIELALERFLSMRHAIYSSYGYTPTALQAEKDAKSHKRSGASGINKVSALLAEKGYKQIAKRHNILDFKSEDRIFLLTDKENKRLFTQLLTDYGIEFRWSKDHQRKMPDFLIKTGADIYIMEHKHMKESGGGQDKQLSEIIDFINFSEDSIDPRVHYIVFMDGLYFNMFTKDFSARDGKIKSQLQGITERLKDNPGNYFVNTAGFKKLLEQI